MVGFVTSVAAGSRVLYLAQSAEESADQARVEFPEVALTHLALDQLANIANLPADSFDFALARPALQFSPPFVAAVLRVLKPGGTLLTLWNSNSAPIANAAQSQLVLSGFVDVVSKQAEGGATEIVAARPPWGANASAPLKLKKKGAAAAAPAAAAPAPKVEPVASANKDVWNLASDDLNELEDDVPLADEDALLAKDTFVAPAPRAAAPADCGTAAAGPKKACKNCSCGLAEQQLAEEKGAPGAAPAKIVSACGSCGLGDAFRCSGCPYLGKPAFNMSETGAVKLKI